MFLRGKAFDGGAERALDCRFKLIAICLSHIPPFRCRDDLVRIHEPG